MRSLVKQLRRNLDRDPGDAPGLDVQAATEAAAPVVLALGERGYPRRLSSLTTAGSVRAVQPTQERQDTAADHWQDAEQANQDGDHGHGADGGPAGGAVDDVGGGGPGRLWRVLGLSGHDRRLHARHGVDRRP